MEHYIGQMVGGILKILRIEVIAKLTPKMSTLCYAKWQSQNSVATVHSAISSVSSQCLPRLIYLGALCQKCVHSRHKAHCMFIDASAVYTFVGLPYTPESVEKLS